MRNDDRSPEAAPLNVDELLLSIPCPAGLPGVKIVPVAATLRPICPLATVSAVLLPSPVTIAPVPMNALTSLFATVTPAPAATPAEPAASTPTISLIDVVSVADTTTLPAACTLPAPDSVAADGSSPMNARVCRAKVWTPAFIPTATLPTATPAATEIRVSCASAQTITSPATVAVTPEPIKAFVRLSKVPTSTPTPIPALPPAARSPATDITEVSSIAETTRLPAETVTREPWATAAVVRSVRRFTAADPATPALPPTATPATIERISSDAWAATDSPPPAAVIVSPAATSAVVVSLRTRVALAAPTPAEPETPIDPTIIVDLNVSLAPIVTEPPARTLPPASSVPSVLVVMIAIDAVPAIPAESPPASVAASDVIVSDETAEIVTLPPALTIAPAPILARVVLVISSRSRLAPTPAAPLVSPSAPASAVTVVVLRALTVTLWPADAATRPPRFIRLAESI